MSNTIGILIIIGIIVLGISGGVNRGGKGLFYIEPIATTTGAETTTDTKKMTPYEIELAIRNAEREVEELKKKVAEEEARKTRSKYYDKVSISYISRSSDPKYEYIYIRTSDIDPVSITGWKIKSQSSGQEILIPQGTKLYFANTENTKEDIVLGANENIYIMTGVSPNGTNFKTNKCIGYLNQFQTFYPSLPYLCPLPKNEDTSSIPKTLNNDACLDYIDSMPSCRIQTDTLPTNWSYECTKFIYDKINYPSCINTHKNDKDFYGNEWRIYLGRSERLWKDRREEIILYDNEGKVVSKNSY